MIPQNKLFEFIQILIKLSQKSFFVWLKVIFILISFFMILMIGWLLFKTSWFEDRFGSNLADFFALRQRQKSALQKKWQNIENRLKSKNEASYKLALIEAEDFLSDILKKRGIEGKTLAEQIKNFPPETLSKELLEELKQSQKVIDAILYNPDYKLEKNKASQILALFRKTLKEITDF
jgi:hypothetical protein